MSMMRVLAFFAIFLAAMAQPVVASQTACTFSAGEAPRYYELEFIGYSDAKPIIVFSSTAFDSGKRITLPPATYSLKEFNRSTQRVNLQFRNPDNAALPPSFDLSVTGGRATLAIDSSIVEGKLSCGS